MEQQTLRGRLTPISPKSRMKPRKNQKAPLSLWITSSPHFSSAIVERGKRERAWKSPLRLAFLAWDYFHVHSRFARSTIPEEKWGLLVVYFPILDFFGGKGGGGGEGV